jgi:hypothetical protein
VWHRRARPRKAKTSSEARGVVPREGLTAGVHRVNSLDGSFDATAFANLLGGTFLPTPVRRHAGMISLEERYALYWLTLNHFAGKGAIVDAGCFLGASSVCFGAALQRRGFQPTKIVHSYDVGIIGSPNMARLAALAANGHEFKKGDSFAETLAAVTSAHAEYIDLRLGDIREKIDEPDPIEILFLDVCKTPQINAVVTEATFSKLIPGRSIVIQQDYFHDWLPWLHMTMGRLSEHFRYLGSAGGSAFFLCEKSISEQDAALNAWFALDPDAALAAFERGLPQGLRADQKYLIDLARTILARQFFGLPAAMDLMERISMPPLAEVTSNWTLPDKDGVRNWITSPKFGYLG